MRDSLHIFNWKKQLINYKKRKLQVQNKSIAKLFKTTNQTLTYTLLTGINLFYNIAISLIVCE